MSRFFESRHEEEQRTFTRRRWVRVMDSIVSGYSDKESDDFRYVKYKEEARFKIQDGWTDFGHDRRS